MAAGSGAGAPGAFPGQHRASIPLPRWRGLDLPRLPSSCRGPALHFFKDKDLFRDDLTSLISPVQQRWPAAGHRRGLTHPRGSVMQCPAIGAGRSFLRGGRVGAGWTDRSSQRGAWACWGTASGPSVTSVSFQVSHGTHLFWERLPSVTFNITSSVVLTSPGTDVPPFLMARHPALPPAWRQRSSRGLLESPSPPSSSTSAAARTVAPQLEVALHWGWPRSLPVSPWCSLFSG